MVTAEFIALAERRAALISLTANDLCRRIGVHRATWQRWKAGKGTISLDQAQALDSILPRVSAEEIEAAKQRAHAELETAADKPRGEAA